MMTADALCLADLDGRTRFVKRARALAREFTAALGGNPAAHEWIMIRSASELVAISEQTRAALLAGKGTVTLNDVVRSENAAARAIRALNIPASAAKPSAPSLHDIAARYANAVPEAPGA
jgi:hypothetical protein